MGFTPNTDLSEDSELSSDDSELSSEESELSSEESELSREKSELSSDDELDLRNEIEDEADLTDENVDVANKDTITQGMKEDYSEFEDEELKYVCRLKGMDKIGYELDPKRRQKTDKAEECESGCKSTDGCTEWSWYSNQYREVAMRLDCFYWANTTTSFRDFDEPEFIMSGSLAN